MQFISAAGCQLSFSSTPPLVDGIISLPPASFSTIHSKTWPSASNNRTPHSLDVISTVYRTPIFSPARLKHPVVVSSTARYREFRTLARTRHWSYNDRFNRRRVVRREQSSVKCDALLTDRAWAKILLFNYRGGPRYLFKEHTSCFMNRIHLLLIAVRIICILQY